MSRALRYGVPVAAAAGLVLLFLLASASGNTHTFERHYPLLLAINAALAVTLLVFVLLLVARLVKRWRARRFGARLMARFAVAFALIGVLPGLLIYVISVQFLQRSIESWFDVRVERALESGLALGRSVLEAQLSEVSGRARALAQELADVPVGQQVAQLERLRERAGFDEVLLLSASGRLIAVARSGAAELVSELPGVADLRQARGGRTVAKIEGDPLALDARTGLRMRALVPVPSALPLGVGAPAEQRLLQAIQRVAPSVAANAEALQSGYREYQELSLARGGLKRLYTATLTLTLLLAVFAAVASGVLLAGSMAAPLLQVAEGTKAVAEGNFRPLREFRGKDELTLLTQSFNAMTRQLAEARDAIEARSRQLENARAYLERVLTNLSAGVIVLDRDWRLVTANHGASRILGVPLAPHVGRPLAEIVPALAQQVVDCFADQVLAATPKDSWQQQIQVRRAGSAEQTEPLALLARGSRLPLDDGPGYVVVFDDITQVISAQRALAWGEVARRLAHEIKNPLTPIQLAAERLQMKLAGSLPPEQAEILRRGTATIVNQVAAMKRMVDDFRAFARTPPARLAPLDLNALIEEVTALYGAGQEGAAAGAPVQLALAPALPLIEGDATQLRQVIHNLIANAQEAIASRAGGSAGRIVVRTEAVAVEDGAGGSTQAVRLSVEDDGPGFAANILRRAFEPYVTTKPGGTGLGLAIVRKIVDEHGARIELVNRGLAAGGGAIVTIVFRRLAQATGPVCGGAPLTAEAP
ncbi:MAG: ATP-binding protein [Burkholderiaceae bacterium]|nr:ATP-binding protein [Burkholderiaceae bacterium]